MNTTMKTFAMCDECQAEYENPLDRRFHAQPNACPKCGPHLELWDHDGRVLASRHEALLMAADAIRRGMVAAVKGLGGFHLIVDACSEEAVRALRERKHREEKPFALMYPTLDLVKRDCEVSELEERLLLSPESPIVLLRRRDGEWEGLKSGEREKRRNGEWEKVGSASRFSVTPSVAPGNPYFGVMLPYTPLHHILMHQLGFPVVATSGNLSDEPICTDEGESLRRLRGIADLFLVHNRPIARHVDDSIVRVTMGREMMLRRARGYAPLPVHLKEGIPHLLAVGAHLKNSVAASFGQEVFVSQHIGDLETTRSFDAFRRVIASFRELYGLRPAAVVCDAHPDYLSTKFARGYGLPVILVQHHHAHVMSCMAENELEGSLLGVSWDGTGYGLDGTIWGGEFLRITDSQITNPESQIPKESFERSAHLRTFRLPGGEVAIKEPRRTAIGLLYEMFGDGLFKDVGLHDLAPMQAFPSQEVGTLHMMLKRKINSPLTSSAGRLFDAVASIVGLRQKTRFEGQAAMELEFVLEGVETDELYQFQVHTKSQISNPKSEIPNPKSAYVVDWSPMIEGILQDVRSEVPVGEISAKFHNTLVETIVAMARRLGQERVVLSGGCFQNKYLTERAVRRLKIEGFRPYWHQRIPPNDGGIALGQILAASRENSSK